MTYLKERTQRDLYLVAKHHDELRRALRELPTGTARTDIKAARQAAHEANMHLTRAIGRAITAGWPPEELRQMGLPVDTALMRAARGPLVSIVAAVIVLTISCYFLPFLWAAAMAAITCGANLWFEHRADKPVLARYNELVARLRQQHPWWFEHRGERKWR